MPKYVAFLRAINVGSHTVKMDQLRKLFEAMGFSKVETVIASGNVVFESSSKSATSLAAKIEKHLQSALGYEVATFIRTPAQVQEIAAYRPFPDPELNDSNHILYVGFLATRPTKEATRKIESLSSKIEDYHVNDREVYWLRRPELGESRFSGAQLEKALRMKATLRNCTTVRRIAAKYS
jgi:uncharacterized protein (DUF1697 family)